MIQTSATIGDTITSFVKGLFRLIMAVPAYVLTVLLAFCVIVLIAVAAIFASIIIGLGVAMIFVFKGPKALWK